MIFFARATRGLRRMGRVAWPSSCSRNAHDQNVLVRRAQSRIDQVTLENEMGKWEDARSRRPFSPHPRERMSDLGRVGGEQPDRPSCSLRPHGQNVLPQCAQ
jgi:hypothetical protein